MVKKSKPSIKVQSKVQGKKETVVSGEEQTTVSGEEEFKVSGEDGGKIDFVLVMMGTGVLIGIISIIVGILRYGLHML
jgi:hypothetical protein